MGCDSCLILFKPADVSLIPLDFLREEFQQSVFQPVLLAPVICLHQTQTCDVNIQLSHSAVSASEDSADQQS